MTHMKKITCMALFVFGAGAASHVMAGGGAPKNWEEMAARAKELEKTHPGHHLVIAPNPTAGGKE